MCTNDMSDRDDLAEKLSNPAITELHRLRLVRHLRDEISWMSDLSYQDSRDMTPVEVVNELIDAVNEFLSGSERDFTRYDKEIEKYW